MTVRTHRFKLGRYRIEETDRIDGVTDTPDWSDLVTAYIKRTPSCPAGGAYVMGNVASEPTCTEDGHELP